MNNSPETDLERQELIEGFKEAVIEVFKEAGRAIQTQPLIHFADIKTKDQHESLFFAFLEKNRKVIYDFKGDVIWVLEDFEKERESHKYGLYAQTVLDRTGMHALTAPDIVFALMLNGIEVEIRNARQDKNEIEAILTKTRETLAYAKKERQAAGI
jgi:hypothetical protein